MLSPLVRSGKDVEKMNSLKVSQQTADDRCMSSHQEGWAHRLPLRGRTSPKSFSALWAGKQTPAPKSSMTYSPAISHHKVQNLLWLNSPAMRKKPKGGTRAWVLGKGQWGIHRYGCNTHFGLGSRKLSALRRFLNQVHQSQVGWQDYETKK